MAVAKPTKPHDLDHFLPAHLPHFSPRCSFFVLHDHCRADAHPPYTHSSAPVHSLRMPPKRSSDRKKKEKKTEKEGKGRLWWPQRDGDGGRKEGGREAPRQAQSHCMRQARREKPFLWRTHARDILAGGLGVVLIFVSGKTVTDLTASGLIMSENEPDLQHLPEL